MTTLQGESSIRKRLWIAIALLLLFAAALYLLSRSRGGSDDSSSPTAAESHADLDLSRGGIYGEPSHYALLRRMPKGGDLHVHLSGAVYAESLIREAAADNLCVDADTFVLSPAKGAACPAKGFPAAKALADQALWDQLIDAYSVRSYVPHTGFSEHDQFFATFLKDGALAATAHGGQWLDELTTRAASQNEQYVEVMHVPAVPAELGLAAKIHWKGDSDAQLAELKQDAEAAGLAAVVAQAKGEFDLMERTRNALQHCGTPQAAPACGVTVRWIDSVLRDFTPEQIFVQTLVAFEVTKVDATVIGVNYLRAEDWRGSIDEYRVGMRILQWMRPQYPAAHLSLHAGELTLGIVPPEDLRDHIRQAVEVAGAERIGHGVDIGYETDAAGLMREMAQKHIMVEINLTSNDAILGVKGDRHPLRAYMAAHVPVALSTDDEGVSRIDITHEYVKAVEEQGLGYQDLKRMARTSLEHAFLRGDSLWEKPDEFTRVKSACAGQALGGGSPSKDCAALLKSSEKAAQQWELERRFADFEANLP
jgi:adenosine deaminase